MENPLTEEQTKRISEIAKLPPEEQQKSLQKFLPTLSEEQIKFLQQQNQGQECLFCLITQGKIPAYKLYEDDDFIAILDINPATKGHTLVFPKEHFSVTTQMPSEKVKNMFNIANTISIKLFEVVNAEGTNIFVANGSVAGQRVPHVIVHVIPRFKDDNLNLNWEGKKANEQELKELSNKIKIEITQVQKEEEKPKEISFEEKERIP